jgi:hypothetical protein
MQEKKTNAALLLSFLQLFIMQLIQQKELLAQLCRDLDASADAYRQYLAGGKTFRYAMELKKYNQRISGLLVQLMEHLSPALQTDAKALLHHYEVWTARWEQLAHDLKPGPDDVFVFANEVTFPRQSAHNLEREYERIKEL